MSKTLFLRPVLHRAFALCIGLLALGALSACSTNQATGRNQFVLMSAEQEQQVGAENHPKIIEAYGGVYDDDNLAFYVTNLVARLASHSELAGDELRVTVLDTPVVNAMALPGGFVYVTRGLLALAPDEGALASVMAHELGHVTARHSAERQTQSLGAGLASIGVAILTGSQQAAQLAQQGSQLYLLSYSRDQEREADDLGSRYMSDAGYDLMAQADMFRSMGEMERVEIARSGQDATPEFLRSHPMSAERTATARAKALSMDRDGTVRNVAIYMRSIDGMIYGDSPSQGFVKGQRFEHPGLKIRFEVPPGFRMENGSQAIVARGEDGTTILFDSVKTDADPRDHIRYEWAKDRRPLDETDNPDAPLPWATGLYSVNGKGVQLFAVRSDPETLYRFAVIGEQKTVRQNRGSYFTMIRSFETLDEREAAALKPYRIATRQVRQGETVATLIGEMALGDDSETRFRLLNGLTDKEEVSAGQWIKLVVE